MFALKILLIDDHKLFSLSLKMILEKYNEIEKIDIISNINDFEKIDVKQYDVYLIDINLNNISEYTGLELAERLIKKDNNICVLILTGHTRLMYEKNLLKLMQEVLLIKILNQMSL